MSQLLKHQVHDPLSPSQGKKEENPNPRAAWRDYDAQQTAGKDGHDPRS